MLQPENLEGQPLESTFSEFFGNVVQRIIHDNLESAVGIFGRGTRSLEFLHLTDPNPPKGEHLKYHTVYELFDSLSQKTSYGILIARPVLIGHIDRVPYRKRGARRHYFTERSHAGYDDALVRQDYIVGERQEIEFLQGSIIQPEQAATHEEALAINELQNDLFNISNSEVARPSWNYYRSKYFRSLL